MPDFWTSLYQPSARRTGGTPVGILRRAVRTASRCLGDWVNAQQGVGMQKITSAEDAPDARGMVRVCFSRCAVDCAGGGPGIMVTPDRLSNRDSIPSVILKKQNVSFSARGETHSEMPSNPSVNEVRRHAGI